MKVASFVAESSDALDTLMNEFAEKHGRFVIAMVIHPPHITSTLGMATLGWSGYITYEHRR